jgi:short-subunit dehydrogenase
LFEGVGCHQQGHPFRITADNAWRNTINRRTDWESEMKIARVNSFVTGAASGIGREIALALARAGSPVTATDLDAKQLAQLAKEASEAGLDIQTALLDVTDREAYEALAFELKVKGRLPAILVNNAGVAFIGPMLDTPIAAWDRLLRVNVMGVVHGCQIFGPQMVATGRTACIVNISSAASASPGPNLGAYAATKYAVEGLSDVLAMELSHSCVRVVSVHPGVVDTAIVHDAKSVSPKISKAQIEGLQAYYAHEGCHPSVVAKAIVEGIRTEQSKIFVGPSARIAALLRRFAPITVKRRLTLKLSEKIGFWHSTPREKAVRGW